MQAVLDWVHQSPVDASEESEIVPHAASIALWQEVLLSNTVLEFVRSCIVALRKPQEDSNLNDNKRARAALRLALAVAVRCSHIPEDQVFAIATLVGNNKTLNIGSEIRFVRCGGLCHHAAAFPFPAPRLLGPFENTWRKFVRISKVPFDDAQFTGVENVFSQDIIVHILRFCDMRTVVRARLIAKEWTQSEKAAQELLWQTFFLKKWPQAKGEMKQFKTRYIKRIRGVRQMKLPLGRRTIPVPSFCAWCDLAFPNSTACKRHICNAKRISMIRAKREQDEQQETVA